MTERWNILRTEVNVKHQSGYYVIVYKVVAASAKAYSSMRQAERGTKQVIDQMLSLYLLHFFLPNITFQTL